MRRLTRLFVAAAAAALLAGQAQAAPLILATKSFTEQHILSAMTVQYLRKKGFSGRTENQYCDSDFPQRHD
ncbi:Uncharacterised protein [Pluralibacter gergoviae]|nr:Uncharacterised protein [Pluralibacter gergoviae]